LNTTYDNIYEYFSRNIRADALDLPSTVEEQVLLIKDGIDEFNIRLERALTCDDITETVSEELTNSEIRYVSECMKLRIYKGMLDDYISVWEVFQNDIGRKNYKDQLNGRETRIQTQESLLNRMADRIYDDYEGEE